MSASNLTEEDLAKLQTTVAEHQQLRENLVKANAVIKTYFKSVEKWQNDVKQSKEADRQSLTLALANNQRLQQDLQRVQRELEEEVARKGPNSNNTLVPTEDMVPRQTYKQVERQCSQLLAENLQFKDMEQQYQDEINCLKVSNCNSITRSKKLIDSFPFRSKMTRLILFSINCILYSR